jgi:Amt family ammonium transporter
LKHKFGYDDSLDVVGVHLVGGIIGSLLLGFFADSSVNSVVTDNGVFIDDGGTDLLMDQLVAVGATLVFSFIMTFIIIKVLDLVIPGGVRVSEEDEEAGLDLTQHSEVGYALAER